MTGLKLRTLSQIGAWRAPAAGLTITLAFCGIFAAGLWESRSRDREQARLSASNVVASISSEIESNLDLYSLSLAAVVDGLKLHDIDSIRPELRQRVLFDRSATAKDMGSIFVLDRNGTLLYDSRLLSPMPEDHSERDYFNVQKSAAAAGLYVSLPWRAIDGHYMAISRRLTDASGAFSGVVVGTLRLSYFEALFREINLGRRDSIALVRENGSMVVRAPFESGMIGRNVANSPVFARFATASSGFFEDVARLDGVERMFVFRHVGEYPLVLSYNLATQDIYAGWRRKAWMFGGLILALCAFNLILLSFLIQALRQRGEAEARLAIMAKTDHLTGLANRHALDETFDLEWRRALPDNR